MSSDKVPFHIRTSNPFLARWQSAVAKVVGDKIQEKTPGLASHELNSLILQHPMMQGTNIHVHRYKQQKSRLSVDDVKQYAGVYDSNGNVHPMIHAYASQYYFQEAIEKAAKEPGAQFTTQATDPGWPPASFPDTNSNLIAWGIAGGIWAKDSYPDPSPYIDWVDKVPNGVKKEDFIKTFSVITIPDDSTIAILGDFGTGLADGIAMLMSILVNQKPDFIIHLGDIYYAGTDDEVKAYVEMFDTAFRLTGGKKVPVFSIPGNHEYYSSGKPFFDRVLKMNADNGFPQYAQPASYFCLRTASTNIQFVAMDTGLNSVHWYDPTGLTDSYGPWLWFSEGDWCVDKLQYSLDNASKTIMLSHHQVYTVSGVINDGKQVVFQTGTNAAQAKYINANLYNIFGDFFGVINAWFWGHEHILGIFQNNELSSPDGGSTLPIARLVGNSGFEEWIGPSGSYGINNTALHYRDPMVEVDTTMVTYYDPLVSSLESSRFYNHGWALMKLSSGATSIPTTYWQYPVEGTFFVLPSLANLKKPLPVNFSENI